MTGSSPDPAPGATPGPGTPSLVDPWERYGWAMGAVWLVFLVFPATELLLDDLPLGRRVAGLASLVAFAAVYVHALLRLPDDPRRGERAGLVHLALMVVLTVPACLAVGGSGLTTLPYVVAIAMFSLRLWLTLVVVVSAVAAPVVLARVGAIEPGSAFQSLVVALVAAATGIVRFIEARDVTHRRLERELEIVAERDRVARDVHDVLGHSLTVLAAKAELAERVLDSDPERARAELAQIRSLTREALAEIRATVAGIRVARLGAELDGARTALAAAGITADVPADPEVVDPRHRLVLAWVLREAVTNVVRHSAAQRCTVTLAAHGLTVADDGRGRVDATEGNGLRGIRERVAAAGGRLDVRPGPGGRGTVVEVRL